MTHYSNTCLLLEWSCGLAAHSEAPSTILGHRVYVNGIAEGQVILHSYLYNGLFKSKKNGGNSAKHSDSKSIP